MTERARGKEAARAALIEAAADLFAERGDVSVRTIAERAGVNHGLVHHYFDGKDGLRRAVLESEAEAQAAELDAISPGDPSATIVAALAAAQRHERYVRILARTLLDGGADDIPQSSFPVVRRVLKAMRAAGVDDAPERVAEGLAASLGWIVFEPWIRAATGLSKKRTGQLLEAALLKPLEA